MSKKDKVEVVEEQSVVEEQQEVVQEDAQSEEVDYLALAEKYEQKFNMGGSKGDSMMALVVEKMKEDNKTRKEVYGKIVAELEQKGTEITAELLKKIKKYISTVVCQTDNKSGIYKAYEGFEIVSKPGVFKLQPKE